MIKAWILVFVASLLVSADSGFWPQQLRFNALHSEQPQTLLWRAAQQGDTVASQTLLDVADNAKQIYWLEKLISVRFAPAALALSHYQQDDYSAKRLIYLAARGGVPEAQYKFALLHDDKDTREHWLLLAAQQGYGLAQTALADWYLLHQEVEKARPWLLKTAEYDAQGAFQLGQLLWREGNTADGRHWFDRAAEMGHEQALRMQTILGQYMPLTLSQRIASVDVWPESTECVQKIDLFATSLFSIEQAQRFYTKFSHDKRFDELAICLSEPIWLAPHELDCDANWQGQGRLGCNIGPLEPLAHKARFTHAVIFAEMGKANVNNGFMYLDVGDTYSVFVHELAHFAGFVDEYPLNTELAQHYCERKQAPNLVFDGIISYAPIANIGHWEAYEKPVEIYPSRTCNNIDVASYKPSKRITFMENHDTDVIPPLYRYIWQQQLQKPSAQRTVGLNFFQYYQQRGDTEKASYWLARVTQERTANIGVN
jgi:TPR repeat protein